MLLTDIKEHLELIDLGDLPYRDTDEEKIIMFREQEGLLYLIEAEARQLRLKITLARQGLEPKPLPKKTRPSKPIPPVVLEFFRRIKKGTDWGPEFKFRWLSPDERFVIWTIPGHLFWDGIGFPQQYAPTQHTLSDLSKIGVEPKMESGLTLALKCRVREEGGRLSRRVLEDMIESALRADCNSARS